MEKPKESYRLLQIKILEQAREVKERTKFESHDYQECQCARSLVASGHVYGQNVVHTQGPATVYLHGITTSGHNLQESLQQDERESKFHMRAWRFIEKSAVFFVTAFLAAIIGAKVPDWVQWLF